MCHDMHTPAGVLQIVKVTNRPSRNGLDEEGLSMKADARQGGAGLDDFGDDFAMALHVNLAARSSNGASRSHIMAGFGRHLGWRRLSDA